MYSSRWKTSTLSQSIPGVRVKASRNSSCDAAVAAMIRAWPRLAMARRIATDACSAAAGPSVVRSLNTLSSKRGYSAGTAQDCAPEPANRIGKLYKSGGGDHCFPPHHKSLFYIQYSSVLLV